ncbi:MAG: sigma-70 family RNA polymerase sigma factor [Candidatus Omnitrophica bacterium]|nr:sigma-70 family RNA polymerase sigma factor [Candidatus Omnitrophota bacterium]
MDDRQFAQSCAKGDKQAWDKFVERYSRLVYNYIYSILKVKGLISPAQNIVNDIFQEIFLSLVKDNFKKLKGFKGIHGCSLASWLRQVTVNFTVDYLRRLRPVFSLEEEDNQGRSLEDILPSEVPLPPDYIIEEEQLSALRECIKGLGEDDKYFLELHLNREVALGSLGDYLGISRAAVDMRKQRIVKRLRECFRGKGFILTQ